MGNFDRTEMHQSKIEEIAFLSVTMDSLNIDISPLNFIGIGMILIFSLRFVLAILINKKILFFCRDIQVALRSDLMKTYQNMSYEEFIENDSSNAIANTTVLSMYFTNNVLYNTLKAFAEVILAAFLFAFLLFINLLLVLILVLGLGLLVTLYSNFFKSRMISYGQRINEANSNLVQSVKTCFKKYCDKSFAFSCPICLIPSENINLSNSMFLHFSIDFLKLCADKSPHPSNSLIFL